MELFSLNSYTSEDPTIACSHKLMNTIITKLISDLIYIIICKQNFKYTTIKALTPLIGHCQNLRLGLSFVYEVRNFS